MYYFVKFGNGDCVVELFVEFVLVMCVEFKNFDYVYFWLLEYFDYIVIFECYCDVDGFDVYWEMLYF